MRRAEEGRLKAVEDEANRQSDLEGHHLIYEFPLQDAPNPAGGHLRRSPPRRSLLG